MILRIKVLEIARGTHSIFEFESRMAVTVLDGATSEPLAELVVTGDSFPSMQGHVGEGGDRRQVSLRNAADQIAIYLASKS